MHLLVCITVSPYSANLCQGKIYLLVTGRVKYLDGEQSCNASKPLLVTLVTFAILPYPWSAFYPWSQQSLYKNTDCR